MMQYVVSSLSAIPIYANWNVLQNYNNHHLSLVLDGRDVYHPTENHQRARFALQLDASSFLYVAQHSCSSNPHADQFSDAKIFIAADVTALVIQAVGGAMASIADTYEAAERGGNIMLAGIIIQLGAFCPLFRAARLFID